MSTIGSAFLYIPTNDEPRTLFFTNRTQADPANDTVGRVLYKTVLTAESVQLCSIMISVYEEYASYSYILYLHMCQC